MTWRHSKVTYRMTVYTSSSSSMNNPLIVSSTNINYKLYVCRLVPPPTTVCFHRLSFSGALKPPARNISNSTFKFHSTNNRRVTAKQTTPLARGHVTSTAQSITGEEQRANTAIFPQDGDIVVKTVLQ